MTTAHGDALPPLNVRGNDPGVGTMTWCGGGGDETRSGTVAAAAGRWGDFDGPWLSEALRWPGEGTASARCRGARSELRPRGQTRRSGIIRSGAGADGRP